MTTPTTDPTSTMFESPLDKPAQAEDEIRASNPWTARGKIGAVFLGVVTIVVLIGLAIANIHQDKPTSAAATKAAPATTAKPMSGTSPRATVPVTMVTAMDSSSCKHLTTVKLANGNIRVIGTECDPRPGQSTQTAATVPTATPAIRTAALAVIARPTILPPATESEDELTDEQLETATVIEDVTEGVLDEMGATETAADVEAEIAAAREVLESAEESPEGAIELPLPAAENPAQDAE